MDFVQKPKELEDLTGLTELMSSMNESALEPADEGQEDFDDDDFVEL